MRKETWVVEYSESQGAYHISTLTEREQNNREAKANGVTSDYHVVALASSYEAAVTKMNERRANKGAAA